MSDEIRVGDRFLVEVEVEDRRAVSAGCKGDGWGGFIPYDALRASKRLPRALKVGDRVRLLMRPDWTGAILAIDGREVWVRWDGKGRSTWGLNDLTLSEEPTP